MCDSRLPESICYLLWQMALRGATPRSGMASFNIRAAINRR